MTLRLHIASEATVDLPDDTTTEQVRSLLAEVTATWAHLPDPHTETRPHLTLTARLSFPNGAPKESM